MLKLKNSKSHCIGPLAHDLQAPAGTEIESNSWVLNGDATNAQGTSSFRMHIMQGSAVTNRSRLVNGDMDVERFKRFFCN